MTLSRKCPNNPSDTDRACDVLCNLVPFVQFKKREKHSWGSVTFECYTPPRVFFTFLKLYKWNQTAQNTTI